MPLLPPPPPPPARWPQALSATCGSGRSDFYALGHSGAYDEAYEADNPATLLSPTSRFTRVLHYRDQRLDQVERLPDRLVATSWSALTQTVHAVGFPRGVVEISATGVGETVLDNHEGVFFGLWGTPHDEMYACGFGPFLMRRLGETWRTLALPPLPSRRLNGICGTDADDVYVVGGLGTILHYDGATAQRLEVPTTRHLLSIARLGTGLYTVGGVGGTLLWGNRKGWRLLASRVEDDLNSLASFAGRVFYASLDGLYAFDGVGPPQRVLDQPCDTVSSVGDAIVLALETSAWLYDGATLVELETAV